MLAVAVDRVGTVTTLEFVQQPGVEDPFHSFLQQPGIAFFEPLGAQGVLVPGEFMV